MGCVKLHILDEQYKRTELKVSYFNKELTSNKSAVKEQRATLYAYCGNNPINRVDKNGKEWTYVIDAKGHITVNVELNFSVSGNFTADQISAYKTAIATQFNGTLSESSGGLMSGTITFDEGNKNIVQSLSLSEGGGIIGGMTSHFSSSVNLSNPAGELRSISDIGSDATHEMLHTLRLEHPFEVTQTEDTKLLRVAPNSFVSTPTTDKNIVNNVMSYPMITIDGMKSSNQNSLTKGQLNFMLNEINLQKQGYGFIPKYNPALSQKQNDNLFLKYYENYWNNIPGTPVTNK